MALLRVVGRERSLTVQLLSQDFLSSSICFKQILTSSNWQNCLIFVLDCLCCHNKMSELRSFMKYSNLFPTVLETADSKTMGKINCLVKSKSSRGEECSVLTGQKDRRTP